MKTKKLITASALMLMGVAMSLGFTNPTEPAKSESNQKLITGEEILAYLRGAPHYHVACCAIPIPGTSNWWATVESGTATVYVVGGIIVSHSDPKYND